MDKENPGDNRRWAKFPIWKRVAEPLMVIPIMRFKPDSNHYLKTVLTTKTRLRSAPEVKTA